MPRSMPYSKILRKGTDADSDSLWLGLKMALAPDSFVLG